jgi:hypothetical protein
MVLKCGQAASDGPIPMTHDTASADLVLRGATVLTMDTADTRAQAVAVRDGLIVGVGPGGAHHLALCDADPVQCLAAEREGLPGDGQLLADPPAGDLDRAVRPIR